MLPQDLSGGSLAVGSRSEVLSTQYSGAVRFTAAVSALKWAYQPMAVNAAAAAAAAAEAVRRLGLPFMRQAPCAVNPESEALTPEIAR